MTEQYDSITPTNEPGIFLVRKADRWGLVDEQHNEITPCKWYYEEAPYYKEMQYFSNGTFVNGYTIVRDKMDYCDNCYRIMDRRGNIIGEKLWSYIEPFSPDGWPTRVHTRSGVGFLFFDAIGEEYDPEELEDFPSFMVEDTGDTDTCYFPNGFGYLTRDGKLLADKGADGLDDVPLFDHAPFLLDHNLLDASGQWLRERNDIWGEWGPYFVVRHERNKTWGLIDRECREVLPCEYKEFQYWGNPAYVKNSSGRWGVLHQDLHWILPCQYQAIRSFGENYWVQEEDSLWGLMNGSGQWLLPQRFQNMEHLNPSDVGAKVTLDGRWGLVGKDGRFLLPCRFEGIWFRYNREGPNWTVSIKENGLYGMIDHTGREIIPIRYDSLRDWNGLNIAEENGSFTILDREGHPALPCQFHELEYCGAGLIVKENVGYRLIDHRCNMDPHLYSEIRYLGYADPCYRYLKTWAVREQETGLWGMMISGEFRIPCRYRDIRIIHEYRYACQTDTCWLLLDQKGNALPEQFLQLRSAGKSQDNRDIWHGQRIDDGCWYHLGTLKKVE